MSPGPRNSVTPVTPLQATAPWSSITLNHKISSHLRALYPHFLEILTFHCTHTIVGPGPQPLQVESIPTQADTVPKLSAIRHEARKVFQEEDETWASPICRYTLQGNLFALLQAENKNITWKSYMWDLPRGVLKFAVNSSIDTLPTFTNIRRCGKRASVNCQFCENMKKQMLFHVLVHCKHSLDQGRLTRRHDSILNHIAGCLKSTLVGKSTVELYCDLDGLQAPGGGLIPADILVQPQRLDLVILDWSVHRIALVELTCPWDIDAKRAGECKASRHADLKTALSGILVCILSRLEHGGIFSSWLRTAFGHYSRLGSL
jgi:hypothetical protein